MGRLSAADDDLTSDFDGPPQSRKTYDTQRPCRLPVRRGPSTWPCQTRALDSTLRRVPHANLMPVVASEHAPPLPQSSVVPRAPGTYVDTGFDIRLFSI